VHHPELDNYLLVVERKVDERVNQEIAREEEKQPRRHPKQRLFLDKSSADLAQGGMIVVQSKYHNK
jgi:hypothetical protein